MAANYANIPYNAKTLQLYDFFKMKFNDYIVIEMNVFLRQKNIEFKKNITD